MLNNDHLLSNVSRTLAASDYYNTKMAQQQYLSNGQPKLPSSSSIFNLGMIPTTTQQGMSQPQIYGYNYNDNADVRIAKTLSNITQGSQQYASYPQSTPLYQQSQAISSLMSDGTSNVKQQPFLRSADDAYNSQSQALVSTYTVTPQQQVQQQSTVQDQPKESFTVTSDSVIISRTTIVIIALIVILFIFVRLWFKQQKLELMLALKYYKESKDINDKAAINAF